MREIVLDTETTGLSTAEDRLVEIGCVEIVDLIPTGRTFHTYINPQRPVHKEAERVHGLNYDFLKTKPTFRRVARKFLEFIGDAQLVAHNAAFDLGFINTELARLDLPALSNPVVDSLALAREKKPGGRHTLDALCSHFKIDTSKRDKHGALLDSDLLAKVYIELHGGRQFGLDLPDMDDQTDDSGHETRTREFASTVQPSELEAHTEFITALGAKSIWAQYVEPEATETSPAPAEACPAICTNSTESKEMQILKRTRHLGMSDEARASRRGIIGGSDARIIMSGDQPSIENLWLQKRGEEPPDDLSEVLIVQMGNVTEALNTDWFELQSGFIVTNEQERRVYEEWPIATTTLDGFVNETADSGPQHVFEAKFMLPWHFTPEKAVEKYFPQVQHNMMVTGMPSAWLSIITGGGQYFKILIEADILYQATMLQAEKDFWECVQTGRTPGNPQIEQPKVDFEQMVVVDMSSSNEWGDLAATIIETKPHVLKYDKAEKAIKKLMPADAKEAIGRGVKISRSKDNKLSVKLEKPSKDETKKAA